METGVKLLKIGVGMKVLNVYDDNMSEWIEIPELNDDDEQKNLHLERYKWAKNKIKGTIVANAACGTNYAYQLLKDTDNLVIGFDINVDALNIARDKGRDLVIWKDIEKEEFSGFTSMVCLETLEHLKNPFVFLKNISLSIKEMVISVPIVPTKGINRWHLHDFTEESFKTDIKNLGWEIKDSFKQFEARFLPEPTYLILYVIR
jgi:O-antigen biosynthesis protein